MRVLLVVACKLKGSDVAEPHLCEAFGELVTDENSETVAENGTEWHTIELGLKVRLMRLKEYSDLRTAASL